jgi:hypothetical protein
LERFEKLTIRSALSGFALSTTNSQMSVFQLDGGNEINPSKPASSVGVLYPGERMDILIEWNVKPQSSDSYLSITLDSE